MWRVITRDKAVNAVYKQNRARQKIFILLWCFKIFMSSKFLYIDPYFPVHLAEYNPALVRAMWVIGSLCDAGWVKFYITLTKNPFKFWLGFLKRNAVYMCACVWMFDVLVCSRVHANRHSVTGRPCSTWLAKLTGGLGDRNIYIYIPI